MNCNDWNEALALGDEASEDLIKAAEEHARTCQDCQDMARGLEAFVEALNDHSGEVDPPEVRDAILAAAREQAEGFARERRVRSRSKIARRALLAAGLGGVVAGSYYLGKSTAGPKDPVKRELLDLESALEAGNYDKVRSGANEVLGNPLANTEEKQRAKALLDRLKK